MDTAECLRYWRKMTRPSLPKLGSDLAKPAVLFAMLFPFWCSVERKYTHPIYDSLDVIYSSAPRGVFHSFRPFLYLRLLLLPLQFESAFSTRRKVFPEESYGAKSILFPISQTCITPHVYLALLSFLYPQKGYNLHEKGTKVINACSVLV